MGALNENIKKFRELRHMTQKQFSERLNKSRNVISNWERGENSPDPDTVEQICKILVLVHVLVHFVTRVTFVFHRIKKEATPKDDPIIDSYDIQTCRAPFSSVAIRAHSFG